MLVADVLNHPPRVLSEAQRARFFADGACLVEGVIADAWLARLRDAMAAMIEESRSTNANDARFILESGHGPETPRLRRLSSQLATLEPPVDCITVAIDAAPDLIVSDVVKRL